MFCPRSALEQSPMQTLRNSPLSVSDSEFDTTSPYSNKYPPCKLNFPLMDAGHTIADISLNPAMPYQKHINIIGETIHPRINVDGTF